MIDQGQFAARAEGLIKSQLKRYLSTMGTVMNASMSTADQLTHLKIVVIALTAAIIVVWLGIFSGAGGLAGNAPTQSYRQILTAGTMITDIRSSSAVR